jgi:penicillin-binding protein 1C
METFQSINLDGKSLQGGSTITQQLIKNTLLTPERTLRRKIRELILAVEVEAAFSKDTILEMYLNEVPYGGSLYGVEEASRAYFGKPVKDLTLAESAMLAGLPQSPSTYSPFGSHPEYAFDRQHTVLDRMVESKFITSQQAEQAKEEKITFAPNKTNIKAPHFVMYVREQLANMFGEDAVSQGGLEVITSLDASVQQHAEDAVESEINRLKGLHVTNGAAMVTNPNTGEIYAMVGSKNYFDVKSDGQVNVALMPRQPGSSIKGLTYATALSHGFTPATILDDSPITFTMPGSKPYSPVNYDGKFHGNVPLRIAFASSYNIPAVKTLSAVGIKTMINQGRLMGITTWDDAHAQRFGLSLTLGGGEVLMADMTKLYGTFANAGETVDLHPILSVKDYKGKILYSYSCRDAVKPCDGTQTLDPRVAYQISNILSDNIARSPAFGTNSVLNIPNQEVAVKTGTTNSLRDNWTIGYTTNRLVAAWVGNNDNSPMSYVASGITGASPIWRTIMDGLLDPSTPHHFAIADGLVQIKICATTGTLPCQTCPAVRNEYFIPGTEPKTACIDVAPSPTLVPSL